MRPFHPPPARPRCPQVTLESHPHIAEGAGLHMSIHPCKHASVMHKLVDELALSGAFGAFAWSSTPSRLSHVVMSCIQPHPSPAALALPPPLRARAAARAVPIPLPQVYF